jgi:hypothetical protein
VPGAKGARVRGGGGSFACAAAFVLLVRLA